MDVGTCEVFVNGVSQGALFRDLSGMEIYPAVAFYSTGRAAKLIGVGSLCHTRDFGDLSLALAV